MTTIFFILPFAVGFGLAEVTCAFVAPFPQAPSEFDLVCVVVGAGEDPPSFFWIHAVDPTTETIKEMSGSHDCETTVYRPGGGGATTTGGGVFTAPGRGLHME